MAEIGKLFAYADDMASTLLNKKHALVVVAEFKHLEKDNLTMHVGKTKFLTSDNQIMEAAVETGIDTVKSFKYLGVEIHLDKEDTINAAIKRCRKFSNSSLAKIKNMECSREERVVI